MPRQRGMLTPQEQSFAQHYAATGDGVYAATKAGYAHPYQRAAANLHKPLVVEEARRLAQQKGIRNLLMGLDVQGDMIADRKSRPSDVNNAVKTALQVAFPDGSAGADEKEPHEQTIGDIVTNIKRYQAELDERDRRLNIINASTSDGLFE